MKRRLVTIILVLAAAIFVIAEGFSLVYFKRVHDQNLARELADNATIELSLINASLISGDQTLLKESHQQYRTTLTSFNSNGYMKNQQKDLLEQLNSYDEVLTNEEQDAELIKYRTAITMLEKEMQDVDLKKVSTKSMIKIKENIEDFKNSLESLKSNEHFAKSIETLTDFSDELIKLIDKTSVCVGTCTESSFKTRYDELEKVFTNYQDQLTNFDAEISNYYSPAKLVEALKMLQ